MKSIILKFVLLFVALCAVLIWQATNTQARGVFTVNELSQSSNDLHRIRVGGRVNEKQITYQTEPNLVLEFEVIDPAEKRKSIPVIFHGLKPDMFTNGRDVIIDGNYIAGKIEANELLTQCPSKYEPPQPKNSHE